MKKMCMRFLSLLLVVSMIAGIVFVPGIMPIVNAVAGTSYENDFEQNADGITFGTRTEDDGNHYMQIAASNKILWNYSSNTDVTAAQMVAVEFDAVVGSDGELRVVVYNSERVNKGWFLRIFKAGDMVPDSVKTKVVTGQWLHVTILFDQVNDKYSVWYDGVKFKEYDSPADFLLGYMQIEAYTANAKLDNLKVTPVDPATVPDSPTYYVDTGYSLAPYAELTSGNMIWNYGSNANWPVKLNEVPSVVYELKVKLLNSGKGTIQLYNNEGSASGAPAASFSATEDKIPDSVRTKFANGQYVNVAMVIDQVNHTYSMWYDGMKVSTVAATESFRIGYFRLNWNAGTVSIENMKVYAAAEPVGDVAEGAYFYDRNFEATNDVGFTPIVASGNTVQTVTGADNNKYLHIASNVSGNAKFLVNYGRFTFEDSIVFQMDIASTKLGTTKIKIQPTGGSLFDAIDVHSSGLAENGKFVNVAIAVNTKTNTYSTWFDGEKVKDNVAYSSGPVTYMQIELTGGQGHDLMVDNLKIYPAATPVFEVEEEGQKPGDTPAQSTGSSSQPTQTTGGTTQTTESTGNSQQPNESTDNSQQPNESTGSNQETEVPFFDIPADLGNEIYYILDFETPADMGAITPIPGTGNICDREKEDNNNNRYLHIVSNSGTAKGLVNYGGKTLSDYVVFQFDFAVNKVDSTFFKMYGDGTSFNAIIFSKDGNVYDSAYAKIGTVPTDKSYVNIAIAVDTKNGTYSAWVDGELAVYKTSIGLTKAKYLQIELSGGDGHDVMVDNIKVYDGVTPKDNIVKEDPIKIPADLGDDVYYVLDFEEDADLDRISRLPGTGNTCEIAVGASKYLKMVNQAGGSAKILVNYNGKTLSDYIVFQMDIASSKLGSTFFKVMGTGTSFSALTLVAGGDIRNSGGTKVASMAEDGTFVNIAIAVNTKTGVYSAWIDGELVVLNAAIGLTKTTYLQIEMTSGGGQDIMIDNLKIYDGVMPKDGINEETSDGNTGDGSGNQGGGDNTGGGNTGGDSGNQGGVSGEIAIPGDLGTNVYHELYFEKYSEQNRVMPIPGNGTVTWVQAADGNHYMQLTNNAKLLLNYNGKELGDYTVVSADVASTNLASTHLKVYGTGKGEVMLSFTKEGNIQHKGKVIGKIKTDGTYVNVAVAVNAKTLKYHVWIDGNMVVFEGDLGAEYGTVRYLQIEPTGTAGENFMVDNMKIYDGVKPIADLPDPVLPDPGNDRYYANDFNDNKEGVMLSGGAVLEKDASGNGYIKLSSVTQMLWNYTRDFDLTEYVIFQADMASTTHGSVYLQAIGMGATATLVVFRQEGTMTPSYQPAEEKMKNGAYINVTVLVNTADGNYTVWYDGVEVVSESMLPAEFGNLLYFRIDSPSDVKNSKFCVDNLKIFNGLTADNFGNTTVPVYDNTRDHSWMDAYIGTASPLLDYGEEVLDVLKSQYSTAIVIHAGSNYVYQNGVRTLKSADDVAKLLSTYKDKVVYKDANGLVIVNGSNVTLTEAQIESLHSYMLYTRPLASDLKTLFNSVTTNEHPRIIVNQEKLDQILADYQTNDLVKQWGDKIITQAKMTIKNKHVQYVREDGTRMSSCRSVLDRAMNLSMAYFLTGDKAYVDYLWVDLETAADFRDWNSRHHFLDTGEFAAGFAIAYDWLYDVWTPAQRKILEEAIRDNGLYFMHRMQFDLESGSGTYIASETNRNAVTNGGLGLAALAVFDIYPDQCADILEKVYHSLEIMMNEFGPDGANTEGPAYWDYLMRFLSKFMASTELTFGTDFNIYKAPGFSTTGEYYLDVDGTTGANNFHDATESTHLYSGYLFWLSSALDKPDLTKTLLFKMKQYNLTGDVYSMLFYDTSIKMDANINMPKDAYYGGLELVSMRSSWVNTGGIYASIHSGTTILSHAHIDSGSFVLDIGGQRFAGDIGKEDYTLAAAGTNRYYYYRIRPEGHNVFVINPDKTGEDLGQNIEPDAIETVAEFVTKDRGSYAILPLDSYYKDYAQSATRGMMLGDDRRSVLIRDEIRGMTQTENEVWWFMQMQGVEVTISEDGKSAILEKGGVQVHMQVLSDNAKGWEIKVLDSKTMYPKEGLPDADKESINTGWTRLAIVFKAGKDLNINVKFAELEDPMGDTPIKDIALADWEIEDGILRETPTLQSITIGGQEIPNFNSQVTFYKFGLPYKTTECPDIEVIGGEGCDIEITKPKKLPGYLKITLVNKGDSTLKTTYKIHLTVNGPVTLEASGYQDGNPPENCLDNDLATRWSVEGEAWGIFRFVEPHIVKAVYVATWLQSQEIRLFDILVSEDGVNFTKVMEVKTELLELGEMDRLIKYEIPEGTYMAIKFECHGGEMPDGSYYSWNSFLEVQFDMVSAVNPDEGTTVNPDMLGPGSSTNPTDPVDTLPSDDGTSDDQDEDKQKADTLILVICLSAAAVLVAGAAVFLILLKKGYFVKKTEEISPEDEAN